jgi:hypothetical protein
VEAVTETGPTFGLACSAVHVPFFSYNWQTNFIRFNVTDRPLSFSHAGVIFRRGATLASSYADVGRKEEALKLREDLLVLRRKVLGPRNAQGGP